MRKKMMKRITKKEELKPGTVFISYWPDFGTVFLNELVVGGGHNYIGVEDSDWTKQEDNITSAQNWFERCQKMGEFYLLEEEEEEEDDGVWWVL